MRGRVNVQEDVNIDFEEVISNDKIFDSSIILVSKVQYHDNPLECLCGQCPEVPLEDGSMCCTKNSKIRALLHEESLSCILQWRKTSLVWNKVSILCI